jgi:hypothetical protein
MVRVSTGKGASVEGWYLSGELSEETMSASNHLNDEIIEMLLVTDYFKVGHRVTYRILCRITTSRCK